MNATRASVCLRAARFLAWFLKEKTGADFPIATAGKADASKPAIRIGAVDKSLLGGMKDLDHVVKNRGKDIPSPSDSMIWFSSKSWCTSVATDSQAACHDILHFLARVLVRSAGQLMGD